MKKLHALPLAAAVFLPADAVLAQRFVRSDANVDGKTDISDGIAILLCLFVGGACPPCRKAADANDSGVVDIADASYIFNFLFLGTRPPPAPFPGCGEDPTEDDLGCLLEPCEPPVALTIAPAATIYAPGTEVLGHVELYSTAELSGQVAFAAILAKGGTAVHEETFPVALGAGETAAFPFGFTPRAKGHYVLAARLLDPRAAPLAEAFAHVGVREVLPGIPETLLDFAIEALDAPAIARDLEKAASTGGTFNLQLGSEETPVQVEVYNPFIAGTPIPEELRDVTVYRGTVLTAAGAPDPQNLAIFTTGPEGIFGLAMRAPGEALVLEPMRLYQERADPRQYLIYDSRDALPDPNRDVGPGPEPEGAGGGEEAAAEEEAGSGGSHFVFKSLKVKVFEHFVSNLRTQSRFSALNLWLASMLVEFGTFPGVVPRTQSPISGHKVALGAVNGVSIDTWTSISKSSYLANACGTNWTHFKNWLNVPAQHQSVNNRLYVLFTDLANCFDRTEFGTGARTFWRSMVTDQGNVLGITTLDLGHQFGHCLDWHQSWDPLPHNVHTSTQISSLEPSVTGTVCTVMRWRTNPCTIGGGVSAFSIRYGTLVNPTPLRHIAEGLNRYFQ